MKFGQYMACGKQRGQRCLKGSIRRQSSLIYGHF